MPACDLTDRGGSQRLSRPRVLRAGCAEAALPWTRRSFFSQVTASAPRSSRKPARCSKRRATRCGHRFEFETCLMGGIAIDADRRAAAGGDARGVQASRRGAARRRRRPEVGRPARQDAARDGPARHPPGPRPVREPAPVRGYPELLASSPLKPERVEGVDLLVVRELTGGLYFGKPSIARTTAAGRARRRHARVHTTSRSERIVRLAFTLARGRKKTRHLGRQGERARVVAAVARDRRAQVASDFTDVTLEHQLVDSCAMRLVTAARAAST